MDFSWLFPFLKNIKGGSKEEIKLIITSWKDLYAEQAKKEKAAQQEIEGLKKQLAVVIQSQAFLTQQVKELTTLQQKCLKNHEKANTQIRDLKNQLIFANKELAKLKPSKK